MTFVISSGIFAVFAGLLGAYYYFRRLVKNKIRELLQVKLFLIKLPLASPREGKDVKEEINISEQFLSFILSFKKSFTFEVAVPYIGEEIHFYAAAPGNLGEVLARQLQSIWSEAEVKEVEDYNIFHYGGEISGAFVKQKNRFILPVRTYREMEADTFLPILGGLTKIKEFAEGGAMQIIVRTAGPDSARPLKSAIRVLKMGWKLKDVLRHPLKISFAEFFEALRGAPKKEKESKEKIVDETALKALESKSSKPLFEVNVRFLTSAPDKNQADLILEGLTEGLSQFGSPDRNEFVVVKPRNLKKLAYQFSFREFDESQSMILNSEELASIFHFPTSFTAIPKIKYLKAREAPPPANLPETGVILGESSFRGEAKEVKLAEDDRRRHVYIVGQTGTGKSNLMINMASNDIKNGKGVAVLDPHGDLIADILSITPPKRFEDVIVFDPSELSRPMGLNMLEYDFNKPEQKTFIVNEMVNIFDKLYDLKATGGPMFEQYMRNALLLLMEDASPSAGGEPATLMEVPRVFTDAEFRNRKLRRIKNPTVIDFWEKEATKAGGEAALANITPYITSKFNTFTANDYMRLIIGQAKSSFNFREVMDEGKIFLANLSKGRIGDINANLLGLIIVGKMLMAALSRVDIPQEARRDFYLYIDEFQNFTTESIATILSEARKYRLSLTIAHQFINQLKENIRDAVFGNVGSIIAFRVGPLDAEFLVKQFAPTFKEQDLSSIDNFNAYVKLLIHGETTKAFNIRTLPAEKGNLEAGMMLKEMSLLKYGRDRQWVEAEIYKRLRE